MNKTKAHWDKIKAEVGGVLVYTKEETLEKLKHQDYYKTLEGRGRNRTLMSSDNRLYKSIYCYSQELEEAFGSQNTYYASYGFYKRVLFLVERNGDVETLRCKCGKRYSWTTYCRRCPDYKRNQLGKPHTEETKQRMRLSALSYIQSLKGQVIPRYNKNSIAIIEQYGSDNSYKFMHAENGGEFFVKELGYFLDAYDPIKNIALEIDEARHFDSDGNLCEKDQIRQQQIEILLGCTFKRIRV